MNAERRGSAIVVQGLEKSYRDWPVLWELDLTVPWGETLSLFGANGAGKTTLLRTLSASVRPDGGSVSVAGHDLRRQTSKVRRRIGVVGHRSLLYEDLSIHENLTFYARLYGVADRAERIADSLERVGLTSRSSQRVRTLSNGMQKRAAIARAILHQPDVLLLDEPEAGLDRGSRAMLGQLLADWTKEGRSAVLTTHDVDLGLNWGHRPAVLAGGRITFPGTSTSDIHQALSSPGSSPGPFVSGA